MGHVTVMVPEGHAIQVHPPGTVMPQTAGMVPDPAMAGAKAAMDSALPVPGESAQSKVVQQPARKKKPAAKKAVEKASGKQDKG